MTPDRIAGLADLLGRTGQAHGAYEESVLGGVYDQEWAAWYAAWAVEHGIGELIGRPIGAEELARFLAATNAELERLDPRPTESWAAWTARRIAAELV
jgi:hypothetical protein